MIAFLSGSLISKSLSTVCIEVGGVGFSLAMPSSDIERLPELNLPVMVYTYLQVREDSMSLYGFLTLEKKALFERLVGVSGVGPKIALAALSAYSAAQLVDAITTGDATRIEKVPGIGKKMAQRIILELKGSLEKEATALYGTANGSETSAVVTASQAHEAASEALLGMGFTSTEIDLALQGAPSECSDAALLQYALKKLGGLS